MLQKLCCLLLYVPEKIQHVFVSIQFAVCMLQVSSYTAYFTGCMWTVFFKAALHQKSTSKFYVSGSTGSFYVNVHGIRHFGCYSVWCHHRSFVKDKQTDVSSSELRVILWLKAHSRTTYIGVPCSVFRIQRRLCHAPCDNNLFKIRIKVISSIKILNTAHLFQIRYLF